MKIKCAVIDNDVNDLEKLKFYLNFVSIETRYVFDGTFFSDSSDPLIFNNFDIFIIDIDMPNINGFKLASIISDKYPNSTIMFCSNHEDLVFDSFKLNTSYFIRKSFLKEDFILAIKKFIKFYDQKNIKYIISSNNGIYSIHYSEIIYFEVVQNYLYIHTKNEEIRERKSLKKLEMELENTQFIKINQNFVVNCDYIKSIDKDVVTMNNGLVFTISRRNIRSATEKYYLHLSR